MTFRDFETEAKRHTEHNLKSVCDHEDAFWASLGREEEHLYGVDNEISLFDERCEYWNLNRFRSADSLIHDGIDMPGITKPYLYVGSMFTAFGLHLEDGNLNSLNFHHGGAKEFW